MALELHLQGRFSADINKDHIMAVQDVLKHLPAGKGPHHGPGEGEKIKGFEFHWPMFREHSKILCGTTAGVEWSWGGIGSSAILNTPERSEQTHACMHTLQHVRADNFIKMPPHKLRRCTAPPSGQLNYICPHAPIPKALR